MKMATAVILAIMLSFLLVGISSIFFSDTKSPTKVIPDQEPLLNKMLWAIQWIGLAAFIAITTVGLVIFANRMKSSGNRN